MHSISRVSFLFFCFIFFTSCASIHSGYYGKEVKKDGTVSSKKKTNLGIVVSVREDIDMSSKYFGMLYFTFENRSQEWIRIKKIKIDFKSEAVNPNVRFTSGFDLKTWYSAIVTKIKISEHNRRMFLGTMAVIGGIVASTSNNKKVRAAGAVTTMGAMTSLNVREYEKYIDRIQNVKIFPENHLFYNQFVIPPGLFVKKWLVLNTENHKRTGYLSQLYIIYQTKKGDEETVQLKFRNPYNGYSQWQKELFKRGNTKQN